MELPDIEFKITMIHIFEVCERWKSFQYRVRSIKNKQMDILKLKNTITRRTQRIVLAAN